MESGLESLEGTHDSKLNKSQRALALKNRVSAIQAPAQRIIRASHRRRESRILCFRSVWGASGRLPGLQSWAGAQRSQQVPEGPGWVCLPAPPLALRDSASHPTLHRLSTDSPRVFFLSPSLCSGNKMKLLQIKWRLCSCWRTSWVERHTSHWTKTGRTKKKPKKHSSFVISVLKIWSECK